MVADTALRLQRYFKVEAQFWLNLQFEYDLRIMKRKIWDDIQRRIIPLQNPLGFGDRLFLSIASQDDFGGELGLFHQI